MIWTIALLAVVNMAIGYGLAIYLQNHGDPLAFDFPRIPRRKSAAREEQSAAKSAPVPPVAPEKGASISETAQPRELTTPKPEELPVETAKIAPPVEPPSVEPPSVEPPSVEPPVAAANSPEVQADDAGVSDDNVLAGIEAFRSQLAKISKASAAQEPAAEVEEVLVEN